jgi:hypothetical protein
MPRSIYGLLDRLQPLRTSAALMDYATTHFFSETGNIDAAVELALEHIADQIYPGWQPTDQLSDVFTRAFTLMDEETHAPQQETTRDSARSEGLGTGCRRAQ